MARLEERITARLTEWNDWASSELLCRSLGADRPLVNAALQCLLQTGRVRRSNGVPVEWSMRQSTSMPRGMHVVVDLGTTA
jgi:hypothetical protein